MQKLEKQIEYFTCKAKVVICGDLNARVADKFDIIQKIMTRFFRYGMTIFMNLFYPVYLLISLLLINLEIGLLIFV